MILRLKYNIVCSRLSMVALALIMFLISFQSHATHIKAGEITARFVGIRDIEFSMFLYLKISALNDTPELIGVHDTATFQISDGRTIDVANPSISDIDNDTRLYVYTSRLNNVAGSFTISYFLRNRNNDILNINNGSSDQTPFYIETRINVADFNTLPRLLIPPIDEGTQNVIYTHNPGAFDVNGDSLSFRLVPPKSGPGQNALYVSPNIARPGNSVSGEASTISIDPVKGDLIWDTPATVGLYNIAIEITEWRAISASRKSVLSVIVRDMQIEIKPNINRRPEIIAKADTCFEATLEGVFRDTILVYDPDSIRPINYQNIFFRAPTIPSIAKLELINPIANGKLSNPGKAVMVFDAGCQNVRRLPYNVTYQAKDEVAPSIQLVTYKSTSYTVYGPKPKGLRYNKDNEGINLTWDKYPCTNADSIIIYRKDCDIANFKPPLCQISDLLPGFTKLKSLPISDITWKDTLNIAEGSKYNYVLGVKFNRFSMGRSMYSDVLICNFDNVPLLTNISVSNTKNENGEILIQWFKPKVISGNDHEYKLYRRKHSSQESFVEIFSSKVLTDTFYLDKSELLNTLQHQWEYKLEMLKSNTLYSTTEASTSVYLTGKPKNKRIDLEWKYNTSWDNAAYKHWVYRKRINEDKFELIDSIAVEKNAGRYTNTGLEPKDTMCYFITTLGRYCSDSIPRPFLNNSNVVCLAPIDSTVPCPPVLSLIDENCNLPLDSLLKKPYKNELSWTYDDSTNIDCDTPTRGFNLYKANDIGSEFTFLKFFPYETRAYTDIDNASRTACYTITAVGTNNIESSRSNIECNDNCAFYALPNLITPNGDNLNDKFNPLNTPVGVEKVRLYVYNRWGALVHFQESGPRLNWNPYETNKNFSDGVYYYLAELTYERRLNPIDNKASLRGWLHIMSKGNGIAE